MKWYVQALYIQSWWIFYRVWLQYERSNGQSIWSLASYNYETTQGLLYCSYRFVL